MAFVQYLNGYGGRDSNKMASERESINFKLPKSITNALRAKAKELNTTATDLVLMGLNHVLDGKFDGKGNSVDEEVKNILKHIAQIESSRIDGGTETQTIGTDKGVDTGVEKASSEKFAALEQKVENISTRLAKIEGAIAVLGRSQGGGGARRQSYNHIPPPMELQPYTADNLGRRLGIDVKTLEREMKNLNEREFESWCRSRDPSGMWWKFENDGFYHPQK